MVWKRKLGYGETLWAKSSEITSNNFVFVVELSGAIDVATFEQAFEKASSVYPVLSAKLNREPQGWQLLYDAPRKPILEYARREQDQSYISVVEEGLNRRIGPESDALWYAVLVHGPEASELVLVYNHILGDGLSAYEFTKTLFGCYRGDACPERFAPNSAVNELWPSRPVSPRRMRFGLRYLQQMLRSQKKSVVKLREAQELKPGQIGGSRLISRALGPEKTRTLLHKARQEQTTLHGVLSAALSLSISRSTGLETASVGLSSAVNLRGHLRQKQEGQFGFLVGSVDQILDCEPHTNFWALAREVSHGLKIEMAHERPLFDSWLRYQLVKGHDDFAAAAQVLRKKARSTVLITNLGRLAAVPATDSIEIKHSYHVPSCHLLSRPFISLACVTMHDVLKLNFTYAEPYTELNQVEAVVQGFLDILDEQARLA